MWLCSQGIVLLGLVSLVHLSLEESKADLPTYVAAVVEYSPLTDGNETEVFKQNVQQYVELITLAASQPNYADIVVFPECGLASLMKRVYSQVPSPADDIAPCHDPSGDFSFLRDISCAAIDNKVYVVINMYEISPCEKGTLSDYNQTCPSSAAFYYNTNIAFDRQGIVVARYRKFNLFGEDGIGAPPSVELSMFTADFGVTFGLFTCFDLMFEKPAVQLVREQNITDVIFPTAWFSELPFLSAVQAQAAWAYGMDVNFLGSGYNFPPGGSAGSGIYAGRQGPLASVMPTASSTHLLVRTVKKKYRESTRQWQQEEPIAPQQGPPTPGIYFKQDNLTTYKTHLLDPETLLLERMNVCHGDFCCDFEVAGKKSGFKEDGLYFYRLLVFNGIRSFDGFANGFLQVCSVVACTDSSLSSCGKLDADLSPVVFENLRIRGSFKKSGLQLPNTLLENLQPLPTTMFVMLNLPQRDGDLVTSEIILTRESPLLVYGIFGRDFSRDGEDPQSTDGAASVTATNYFTAFLLVTACLINSFLSPNFSFH